MRRLLIAGLVVSLLGCCSSAWRGHNVSELLKVRDAPTEVDPDGQGGDIYVWRSWVDFPPITGGDDAGFGFSLSTSGYWRTRAVYVDSKGIICRCSVYASYTPEWVSFP